MRPSYQSVIVGQSKRVKDELRKQQRQIAYLNLPCDYHRMSGRFRTLFNSDGTVARPDVDVDAGVFLPQTAS